MLSPPEFPSEFDWPVLRASLEDYFFRLQNVQAFVPSGAIIEYAGASPPDGWVEADGTEYPQNKFPELYKVIGVESTPGNFEVPDATATPPTVGQIWIIKV